jgi:ABC-2 type transport system permease protein
VSTRRILALVRKDLAELARRPGALLPPVLLMLMSVLPAFLVVLVTPAWSGERLDVGEFARAAERAAVQQPAWVGITGLARVQALLFQQFLLLTLTIPIVSTMALAAHAVIGEKQARTLEPLLATPLKTWELLAAKTITPLLVSAVLYLVVLLLYAGGIAAFAETGVLAAVVNASVLLLVLVDAPLVALLALLIAVIMSSRVNDPRSAQQLGALIVLPVTLLFVVQLMRGFLITPAVLIAAALVLVVLNLALLVVGVRVFDREAILTDWR